jgi:tetratricopeptide (TPR) repeat protein
MRANELDTALPMFTRAVEVNRNHRLLRQVIVELLSHYGETAFFENKLERCVRILEIANRILPRRTETKTYLAYGYHRLKDYAKAIIFYHDIKWSDDNPRLERSHAYAYLSHQQPEKAWRVFLDLARRGNLLPENFPRLVACFLADSEATNGRFWGSVEFPENANGLLLSALYLHDGEFSLAAQKLEELVREDAENPQLRWFLGQAYSQMGKRDMAVHNWLELIKIVRASAVSPEMKIRQFTEIGLAFLNAGYAPEAMQTWDELRQLDESNADLPVLYAATLDLNAYQLARKDQNKLALEEWRKALGYDADNPFVVQNVAISNLLLDDYDKATGHFMHLTELWIQLYRSEPRRYAHLERAVTHLEKAMNTLALTKGRAEFDLTKVRAEDVIHYYQKANQFYWILSLDKRATQQQIEVEYFRLIKIFNPERHADDFMLVEESYTNLFANPKRRELIDLFVFNPVDVDFVRSRLTRIPRDGAVSFEQLQLPDSVPPPDFQQLTPAKADEGELVQPLVDLLAINFKIPDWTMM